MAHPLRDYREKHGLTQAQLAKQLKVSRQMVGLIELGERDVPPTSAAKWEKVTGIPCATLRPDVFAKAA